MAAYDYIHDGTAIYDAHHPRRGRPVALLPAEADVAIRMIHACGQVEAARSFVFSSDFVSAARTALSAGAPIFCDAEMVSHGVTRARLPAGNEVICTLRDPCTTEIAKEIGNTRSAAAIDLWGERMAGSVVAIGNAPTALFYLLERLRDGAPKPAAIIGMPVGFVGAQESKEAAENSGVPYAIVRGRLGGSAADCRSAQFIGEAWPVNALPKGRLVGVGTGPATQLLTLKAAGWPKPMSWPISPSAATTATRGPSSRRNSARQRICAALSRDHRNRQGSDDYRSQITAFAESAEKVAEHLDADRMVGAVEGDPLFTAPICICMSGWHTASPQKSFPASPPCPAAGRRPACRSSRVTMC